MTAALFLFSRALAAIFAVMFGIFTLLFAGASYVSKTDSGQAIGCGIALVMWVPAAISVAWLYATWGL